MTSSQAFNHFLWIFSGKTSFLFNQLKISTGTYLVENFKFGSICCKISVSKKLGRGTLSIVHISETRMRQTQEIKTFSAKNECNGVDFGVVTKFKFRYSIVQFPLVWINQLTGLHLPPWSDEHWVPTQRSKMEPFCENS